jgi:hypothetical protein
MYKTNKSIFFFKLFFWGSVITCAHDIHIVSHNDSKASAIAAARADQSKLFRTHN